MSTHSTISIEWLQDRTVSSIYCHMDGYLSYNGALLSIFHNSFARARRLIELGGLSSLGMDFMGAEGRSVSTFWPASCSMDEDCDHTRYRCVEEMRGEEFNYVWAQKYDMWFVACDETHGKFKPLDEVLDKHAPRWRDWRVMAASLGVPITAGGSW